MCRHILGITLGLLLLAPSSGCNSAELSDRVDDPNVLPVTSTEITASVGGTATSHDATFAIEFPSGAFAQDVTVTVTEGVRTAAAAVTVGKLYEIRVAPAGALAPSFLATLTFDAAAVPGSININDLVVATGEVVGALPTELLPITHDADSGTITATTIHLSWFGLIDEGAFVACSCDTTDGCDDGCEFCDEQCVPPARAGQYPYPTCISTSGCDTDEKCLDGWCAGVCTSSNDCAEGLECRDGWCVASCQEDSDCTGNYGADCCFSGICVVDAYCGVTGPGESCSTFFDTGDGCDCGCGGIDPDCDGGGCSFPGCADAACDYCWDTNSESTTCVQAP